LLTITVQVVVLLLVVSMQVRVQVLLLVVMSVRWLLVRTGPYDQRRLQYLHYQEHGQD
jgi:hypothetical protein